eukprot:7381428-Prymnesium_polylepis.1
MFRETVKAVAEVRRLAAHCRRTARATRRHRRTDPQHLSRACAAFHCRGCSQAAASRARLAVTTPLTRRRWASLLGVLGVAVAAHVLLYRTYVFKRGAVVPYAPSTPGLAPAAAKQSASPCPGRELRHPLAV